MPQKYKIFHNQHRLVIFNGEKVSTPGELEVLYNGEIQAFIKELEVFEKQPYVNLALRVDDPEGFFAELKKRYIFERAAGGLVWNEADEALFIHRFGFFDLPKGHVEGSETYAQTALREVEEETGVAVKEVGKELPTTFHIFCKDDGIHLKETHWFEMHVKGDMALIPQTEEGIEQVQWVHRDLIRYITTDAYASIREMLKDAGVF